MTEELDMDFTDKLAKSEQQAKSDKNLDPERCIYIIRDSTTLQAYDRLKNRLSKYTAEWMDEFLELGGLGLLLEALEKFCDKGNSNIGGDSFLQSDCIECIKAVLNSKRGMDFIIETRETKHYTRKLAFALDSLHVNIKKMVFEILSALSVYSVDGCGMAIDALEFYKKRKNQRYRFSIVINELKSVQHSPYTRTLMGFINSLLESISDVKERRHLRNEFIGLGLLDIIASLRAGYEDDASLCLQLKVFDEGKALDDDDFEGIDINSAIDVFHAVFNKVSNSPQGMALLSILQLFLQLEPNSPVSDTIWQTTEKFLRHANVLDNVEQIEGLLKFDKKRNKGFHLTNNKEIKSASKACSEAQHSSTTSSALTSSFDIEKQPLSAQTPPPPPLPPPPPPPPPPPGQIASPSTQGNERKVKLKVLHWRKIQQCKINETDNNIWRKVSMTSSSSNTLPEYDRVDELFVQPEVTVDYAKSTSKEITQETNLLSDKWILNVNIWLRGLHMPKQTIIDGIREVDSEVLEEDKLLMLKQLLSKSRSELDKLTAYTGDKAMLGTAERFLLQILDIKDYELRLDCMLMKEEFESKLFTLEFSFHSLIKGGKSVLASSALQEFLRLVLLTGNYMNKGSYAGNADGFTVSFLNDLKDIKAKQARVTLLHHLVRTFGQDKSEALIQELEPVSEANRYSLTELKSEVNILSDELDKMQRRLSVTVDIQRQMSDFLDEASQKCCKLQEIIQETDELSENLAMYFCEDVKIFTLDELVSVIDNFTNNVDRCLEEIKKWEKENATRTTLEEEEEEVDAPIKETCIIDMLLDYIATGFQKSQKIYSGKRMDDVLC
ncbi:inverted formin-2-like isoform X1 [Ptychodera flava]|uniref:inverted formin-2-like isoform X1 n=1 Tax=Ptychodera flava TaxID=63121 RepID=UPI00396AAEC3